MPVLRSFIFVFAILSLAACEVPRAKIAAEEVAQRWRPVLVDIEGQEHRPFDDQQASALAVVFILPDCPIANSYVPELNRLAEWLEQQNIPLLLVHADPDTALEEARQHAREYELRAPVVLDPKHEWVERSEATRVPEAVIFSTAGDILYRGRIDNRYAALGKRRAHVTEQDFRTAVKAIVAGNLVPQPRTEAVGCFIPDRKVGVR